TPQGQYCGDILPSSNCISGNVYECNPEGGACDYGVRKSCVECEEVDHFVQRMEEASWNII
ncbi:12904_t:CDS:2, partial [Funneliformis mosseae]